MLTPLTVACLPFTAGPDIAANAAVIRRGIEAAAKHGVQLLTTPEASLTGYPSKDREDLESLDWSAVAAREDELAECAGELGVAVVIGSGSPWDNGVSNDALLCGAVPQEARYRKCCLTGIDQVHYRAGSAPVVAEVAGWQVGLTVCYDLRFPDLWGAEIAAGADAFVSIAYMAGEDLDGLKSTVVPAMLTARCAESGVPLVACNTAHSEAWYPSQIIDHRGAALATAGADLTDGLLISRWEPLPGDGWYAGIRRKAKQRWQAVFPNDT